ncbi:MAG: hypothetical protein ACPGTU_07660 [Myxococcota bacterium]
MNLRSPRMRMMTGFMTIGLYFLVGATAWPTTRWISYVCAILAAIRLVLLVRQLPSKE